MYSTTLLDAVHLFFILYVYISLLQFLCTAIGCVIMFEFHYEISYQIYYQIFLRVTNFLFFLLGENKNAQARLFVKIAGCITMTA